MAQSKNTGDACFLSSCSGATKMGPFCLVQKLLKERSFLKYLLVYQASQLLPSWTSVWATRFALDSGELIARKCFDVNR